MARGRTHDASAARFACGCPRSAHGVASAGAFGLRHSVHLPGCALATHEHAEARIVLPLQHVFESRQARLALSVRQGEALYRPAGVAHSDRYAVPVACVVVMLPDAADLPRVGDSFVARGRGLAEVARALLGEMSACDAAADLVREGLAVLAATLVLQRRPLTERGSPRWLQTVRERLADPAAATPTLSELARSVDRDPAHVAATFKRVYGQSMGATLRRLRLEQARTCLLDDPACALSEIALRFGFADQSHFTRQFRQLFGVAPGLYRGRQRLAGGAADASAFA